MKVIYIVLAFAVASCSAFDAMDGNSYHDEKTVDSEAIVENPQEEKQIDEPVQEDPAIDEPVVDESVIDEPIEEEPKFFETRYSVFGYWRSYEYPDYIETAGEYVFLNGSELTEEDYTYTIADGIRTIRFDIFIDQADQFFFRNTVFIDRFGIDLQNMSIDDLRTFADIVNRYPAESMTVLLEEYGV